jgi:hypothetical protein
MLVTSVDEFKIYLSQCYAGESSWFWLCNVVSVVYRYRLSYL